MRVVERGLRRTLGGCLLSEEVLEGGMVSLDSLLVEICNCWSKVFCEVDLSIEFWRLHRRRTSALMRINMA
jgi:hypothetical protein